VQLLPKGNGSISAGGTGRFVPSDNPAVAEGEQSARTDENFPEEAQQTETVDDVPF
jgi:hypothetical protein